jgi:hypothetical protein
MPLAVDLFVKEHGRRIIIYNLRKNFSVMCQLFLEQQLVSQSVILRAHLALDVIARRMQAPPPIDAETLPKLIHLDYSSP